MNHTLPLSTSSTRTGRSTGGASTTRTPWRARMRRLLVIDFADLDTLDFNLGTPHEFDSYVCHLFERGGHIHS